MYLELQVHIACFIYLQVQKSGYVYLESKFQISSTLSLFFVLASMKNRLCVLGIKIKIEIFYISDVGKDR